MKEVKEAADSGVTGSTWIIVSKSLNHNHAAGKKKKLTSGREPSRAQLIYIVLVQCTNGGRIRPSFTLNLNSRKMDIGNGYEWSFGSYNLFIIFYKYLILFLNIMCCIKESIPGQGNSLSGIKKLL